MKALFLSLISTAAWTVQADYFVSPTGSDQGSGSREHPFLTLERARDAFRERKAAGQVPKGGMTIWLTGGDYFRAQSLQLSAADSGTPESPVVWRSERDQRVRLLGGRILPAFTTVTDPGVLRRLDESARSQVRQIQLSALGVTNFGTMKSRGFARGASPAHNELFYGGKPMTLARWPNEGQWQTIAGFPESSGKGDDHGGKIGELPEGFFYSGERPRRWEDVEDLWVHGYWAWDWANSYERVEAVDLNRRWIRTAPPHGLYGFRKGQRFYFLNALEELDQPGEWFLNRKEGLLYFWPPADQGEAVLSTLSEPLIQLRGVSNVVIRGLVLEATRGNAIEIHGGSSNLVAGCILRNIGNNGVVISGGRGHGVVNADMIDTGDGGVSLDGGDRQTLTPGGHFVENCHFQRQGRWSKCYVPAVQMSGVGQRVSNNLIHDHPHAAILFTGNDHLIDFNEIHHIALETGDVGAIYTGRDYSFRGNRIRHNYIHETGGVGMGSMGVYMDDCVSGAEVFGNIFYKVHWAMFIGGGRDHRVENNIFVECDPAVRADGRGLDTSPVWRNMVNDFMRKQLSAVPAERYRERYPEIKSLDRFYSLSPELFKGIPPENNLIARNVVFGKWFEAAWHSTPQMFALDGNFIATNRNQIGSSSEGFGLPKDSPAWKLGFQAIPFSKIGLQSNEDRSRLARIR